MFNQKTSRELKIEDTSVNIRFALRRRTRNPHETDDIIAYFNLHFAFCKQLQKQYYDYSHTTPFLFSFTFFPFVASVSFFFFLSLLIGVCIVRSDRTLRLGHFVRRICIINTLHGPCMFYATALRANLQNGETDGKTKEGAVGVFILNQSLLQRKQ